MTFQEWYIFMTATTKRLYPNKNREQVATLLFDIYLNRTIQIIV